MLLYVSFHYNESYMNTSHVLTITKVFCTQQLQLNYSNYKLYMGYNNHKGLEREAATLDIKMASII